nr:subtilisin-like protease sbt4.4 [Quercus suber]
MTAMVSPLQSFNVTFHRTVTNVGFANSTYKATTFTKSEVKIIVEPEVLSFTSVNEKSSFVVHFTGGQGILPTNYSRRPHHCQDTTAIGAFHAMDKGILTSQSAGNSGLRASVPDITAPGEEISAAYSPIVSPTSSSQDKRRVKYNILSGTSTSCLHAAGEAAYVKNFHPDWSASAIKSAIMTMGSFMVLLKKTTSKCDASKEDYIKMLCGLGYDERKLRHITGANSPCPKVSKKVLPRDLNYPSLTAMVSPSKSSNVTFHRIVTNVGFANTTYKATTFTNSEVKVVVEPEVPSSKSLHEKKSSVVSITEGQSFANWFLNGILIIVDGEAIVVAKSRDIDVGDFTGLKDHHALWDFQEVPIDEHFDHIFRVGEMDSGSDQKGIGQRRRGIWSRVELWLGLGRRGL